MHHESMMIGPALGRRTVLRGAGMVSLAALVPPGLAGCQSPGGAVLGGGGVRIAAAFPRADTIRRLGGMGFGYQSTWAADGAQYMTVNDGAGFRQPADEFYNARLWRVDGDIAAPRFSDVAAFPSLGYSARPREAPRYFGVGVLAVDNRLYQFLNTLDRAEDRPRHWTGAKLIYSPDGGRSWHNQDGSTPVVWEDWTQQKKPALTFFDEPDGAFAMLSFLQMGQGYRANRDGYVYVYGLNGNVDGRMNQLVLFRAPVEGLLDRSSYEFYAGANGGGAARWSSAIADRAVVHAFPTGWINYTNLFPGDLVVESWLPSVAYNEALGLYMMTNSGIGVGADGTEFGRPSYFGIWVSPQPWGPWRQVHQDAAWTPNGDPESRAYLPRILPKWIAPDGKSFWMAWSDIKGIREFGRDEGLMVAALEKAKTPAEHTAVELDFLRRYMPGMTLNVQRVDLTLS